jgi:hypothetical protein
MRRIRLIGKTAAVASSTLLGAAFVCSYAGWVRFPFFRSKLPAPIVVTSPPLMPPTAARVVESPNAEKDSEKQPVVILPRSKMTNVDAVSQTPEPGVPPISRDPTVLMGGSKSAPVFSRGLFSPEGPAAQTPDTTEASPSRSANAPAQPNR